MVQEVGAQCHSGGVFVSSLDANPNGYRLVHCYVGTTAAQFFVLHGRLSKDAVPVIEPGTQHGILQ
jgi:hypothetical protein